VADRAQQRARLRHGVQDRDLGADRDADAVLELVQIGGVTESGRDVHHGDVRSLPEATLPEPAGGLLQQLEPPLTELPVPSHRAQETEQDPVFGVLAEPAPLGRLDDDRAEGRRTHLDHRGPHGPTLRAAGDRAMTSR
jgi:hypothetical protein